MGRPTRRTTIVSRRLAIVVNRRAGIDCRTDRHSAGASGPDCGVRRKVRLRPDSMARTLNTSYVDIERAFSTGPSAPRLERRAVSSELLTARVIKRSRNRSLRGQLTFSPDLPSFARECIAPLKLTVPRVHPRELAPHGSHESRVIRKIQRPSPANGDLFSRPGGRFRS